MDEEQKKTKWEIVSLAKMIFAEKASIATSIYNPDEKKWKEIPLTDEYLAIEARSSIHAAEIFYEELAKKEGAT